MAKSRSRERDRSNAFASAIDAGRSYFNLYRFTGFAGDPKLLHEFVKGRPADPKFARGRADFSPVSTQRTFHQLSFDSFTGVLQGHTALAGLLQFQICRGNLFPSAMITARFTRFCISRTFPGQRVTTNGTQCVGRKSQAFFVILRRVALKKFPREQGDVIPTIS